jgi:hypothetical protein
MTKVQLRKYLNELDKKDIIKIILDTYSKNKDAKEYLDHLVNPNTEKSFLKAKNIISKEFHSETSSVPKARLSVVNKAIKDFLRLTPEPEFEARILIFLVEQKMDYADEYGVMDDPFYDGILTNFIKALEFMEIHDLLEKFKIDAEKCLKESMTFSIYFMDYMKDIFNEFYS